MSSVHPLRESLLSHPAALMEEQGPLCNDHKSNNPVSAYRLISNFAQKLTMPQSQLPTIDPETTSAIAGSANHEIKQAEKGAKGKTKPKPKPKTLKRVLPSGPGFKMYQNAADQDLKILESIDEGMAFKNALRALTPNLDKEAVDLAIAKLFLEADRLSGYKEHITENSPGPFSSPPSKPPGSPLPRRIRSPPSRPRIVVKFSHYRQQPIEDYAKGTATALAIDKFRKEKPCDEPEEIFTDFTEEQRKNMMGKTIRREKADWGGKHVDENCDTQILIVKGWQSPTATPAARTEPTADRYNGYPIINEETIDLDDTFDEVSGIHDNDFLIIF
ncbi:hypothetical protein BDP55DRAFT_761919 [Colletotrichum godetiae]|uniref:Uncharacterized protein n=1 Tax=Colletotrichum godetiae TaxID=1209918 RepID=A0AAJ0EN87_9PEZI|nr:uncharacterized protein BDP55DRAFT_761919 [Colletotrichum godetiae]KAK1657317.1 hypothetical protein BDP55DRAFT_761919 [Colletotrichum godetiae]